MKHHPLQKQYDLYHQNFDAYSLLSVVDGFKLDVAKLILDLFIQYPTLNSISIDFKEVKRIAEVFEGSNEDLADVFFKQIDDSDHILFFDNSQDGLKGKYCDFINIEDALKDIKSVLSFMSEEPSFLTKLIQSHRSHDLPLSYEFSYDRTLPVNDTLISQLDFFIGGKLKSALLHQQFNQELDNSSIVSLQHKI